MTSIFNIPTKKTYISKRDQIVRKEPLQGHIF